MYRRSSTVVDKKHPLYQYLSTLCHLANNMENAATFCQRQLMTGLRKDEKDRQPNEREVIESVRTAIPHMSSKTTMPTAENWMRSRYFWMGYFSATKNKDYFADFLPRQSAQHAIHQVCDNFKGWAKACAEYKKNPDKFTGKPKVPGYHKPGGMCTAYITNQDAVVYKADGHAYLKLPKTKTRLQISDQVLNGRLKQVAVKPYHEVFVVNVVWDDGTDLPELTPNAGCIAALDLGVNNIAAMTNNAGHPCVLFKGGSVLSTSRARHKVFAREESKQTKGTTNKFRMTPKAHAADLKRHHRIHDFMSKLSNELSARGPLCL